MLSSLTARAETEDGSHAVTRTAARDLALQGSEAFDKGEYQAALDLFRRAGELVQAPTISLMQARSLVHLGRWVEAMDTFEAAQRLPGIDPSNAAYRAAIESAAEEGQLLKARIPRLKIELDERASSEVEVWLDGGKLPGALIGVEIPCDPGEHRVEVRAPDQATRTQEILLGEGARETLTMTLATPPAPSRSVVAPVALGVRAPTQPEPLPVQAVATPRSQPSGVLRTMSWVALASGGVSMGAGVVTSILALRERSQLDEVCHPGCPPAYGDDIERFRGLRTASYLTIGIGAAVAALGGSYLLFSHEGDTRSTALYLDPTGLRVTSSF